ncbi:MAG TPA: hypothetical protein VM533_16985 [Fimbriiglobus sp.]|nr:hypothetical protein [Fimbriiglobus sp.]
MARFGTFALLAAALAVPLSHVRAGVYSPDAPSPFPVRADGTAEELPFGPEFEGPFAQQFGRRLNEADDRPEAVRGSKNEDRAGLLARIDGLKGKGGEAAALSAAYLRAGKPTEALNLLAPLSRSRSPDFRVLAHFAHAHAVRGEWEEAVRWHQAAVLDAEFPDDLPDTTPEQRKWLLKVERQHYTRWLQIHRQRAAAKFPPDREEVFPLFDVKFVNDAGTYEPGKLAAAEKAKLPPDAVAVVQQLLLWAPWDTGLYWLLAELYAADGRVRPADVIFFQCANSRQYSNRQLLMDHRHVVREAAEKARREAPTDVPLIADTPPEQPKPNGDQFMPSRDKLIAVGVVFGMIVLVLLALQFRAIGRRLRGGCGPSG